MSEIGLRILEKKYTGFPLKILQERYTSIITKSGVSSIHIAHAHINE